MLLAMICVLLASCSTQTAMPQAASKVTQANASAEAAKAPIPAPAAVNVKITLISAALIQNNHVGNEWGYAAAVNAQPIQIGETMNAKLNPADRLVFEASATEADKYPDNGNATSEIAVSSLTEQQTTVQMDVVVTENRGRYSGNTAKWRFVFQIEK